LLVLGLRAVLAIRWLWRAISFRDN
jgi:hypothetical protein